MQAPPTPRLLALGVLGELERRDAYSDALLTRSLDRHPRLAARERALARGVALAQSP